MNSCHCEIPQGSKQSRIGGDVYQTSLSKEDEETLKQTLQNDQISEAADEALEEELKE